MVGYNGNRGSWSLAGGDSRVDEWDRLHEDLAMMNITVPNVGTSPRLVLGSSVASGLFDNKIEIYNKLAMVSQYC